VGEVGAGGFVVAHAGDGERTHPAKKKPELVARRPNQIWGWDITKLHGPTRGVYYELFVIIDIFSRYVVGWMVSPAETGQFGVRQTLRRKYAGDADLRIKPIPELANYWNLGLSVVTSDRFLLMSERGATAMDPDVFGPAVAEGVSRPKDSTAPGAPDNLSAARRGMEEELGIPLDPSELTWLSFGASSKDCEYVLIGCVFSRFSLDEVRRRRSVGVKDAWENKELHAVEFDPQAVAEFCSRGQRFSPYALACIVHTLIYEFGLRDTEAAFVNKHVRSSHDLPGWL
jgi:hypothetical protein